MKTPPEKGHIEGMIRMNTKGMGFVTPPDSKESIVISPEHVSTALPRDIVRVRVTGTNQYGEKTGEVVEIVLRHKEGFVGILERDGEKWMLAPDDQRVPVRFLINPPVAPAALGKKVFVKMDAWTDAQKPPTATLLEVIGDKGDNDVEIRAIVLDRGLAVGFPPEVEKEASAIPHEITAEEIAKRRDMRSVLTFTIDPEDAKDFDDAISYEVLDTGDIEVGVHIADVAHYVREGTAIDREAEKRGTSIYLVDRVIPMLPEVLSNDLCSLNPGTDKLAFAAVFTFSKKAFESGKIDITKRWFGRTVIHSNKRFTYEEAQKSLDTPGALYHDELKTLDDIALLMRKDMFAKGKIAFEKDEVKFKLDPQTAKPIGVYVKERIETNKLIEDWMLLANKEVAEFIVKNDPNIESTFIYRIHDVPDQNRMEELSNFLRSIGYDLPVKGRGPSSKDINALLKKIVGKPEENLIQTAVIRTMAKAVYSTQNIGHYGLAFEHYTHFTSPIRRYPDTMVHRFIANYLEGKPVPVEKIQHFEAASRYASAMEQTASDAERASIKFKQVEYMMERIGKTYTGIVSGVVKWGLYVEEEESRAEGLLHIKNIGDDFYTLDEKNYRLIGERTKKMFSLGDKIKIRVKGVDFEKRMIDYELVR